MSGGIEGFRSFIAEHGFEPPARIEPGRWCPFSANGKKGNTAGRAKLFPDGEGGVLYDWRTNQSWNWQAKRERPFTDAEARAWREKCERAKQDAEAERERERKQTADRAQAIWEKAQAAPEDHPYLIAKRVKPHGLRLYRGPLALNGTRCDGALVIPARTSAGGLASLQFIAPGGEKLYLNGEKYPACYFSIGKPDGGPLLIAEGYATGASMHEATGHAVAVAFSAGNLAPVAKALRAKFPEARLILCADDDAGTDGNPGLTKATEAARAVGGLLAVPEFGDDRPEGVTDFNDLAKLRGAAAVKQAIEAAGVPGRAESKADTEAGNAPDASPIVALEIGDLLAREFPPKEPLLFPWLRRQDLAMVFAERGIGKTHFCLTLAYAVACGGKFMKWEAPKPRRVLYIDGEMPGAAIKGRLAALVESMEKEPPEGYFRIITPDVQSVALPDLATMEGQAEIGPLLGDAELIVLDNLSALTRAGVENEGESWVPMATWALARRREGRTVMFVHHAGKNGAQRGSSRREDLLDVSIRLKRPGDYNAEQGARFEVEFTKARGLFGEDVRAIEAALTPDAGSGFAWSWRNVEGATVERVAQLQALGMTVAEIANELGLHRSNVYRALKKSGGVHEQA